MSRTLIALLLVIPPAAGCTRPTSGGAPAAGSETESSPAEPREQVENPAYRRWANFKAGTSVTYRAVTGAAGEKGVTATTTTYKLVELTDERAVVEMTASTKRYDGLETNNPPEQLTNPRLVPLPPGVSKADFGKPPGPAEPGEEVVESGGRTYKTRRHESKASNEAGPVLVTTWTSDEVPGGLVKSVTVTPAIGKTTATELVALTIP